MVERFQQFRFDHEKPRAGIVQDVPKLRSARGDIDRDRDRAEPGAAEKGFEEFGAIGAHQRDAVARVGCLRPPACRQSAPRCAGASSKLQLASPRREQADGSP